jgi:hypothetical protein
MFKRDVIADMGKNPFCDKIWNRAPNKVCLQNLFSTRLRDALPDMRSFNKASSEMEQDFIIGHLAGLRQQIQFSEDAINSIRDMTHDSMPPNGSLEYYDAIHTTQRLCGLLPLQVNLYADISASRHTKTSSFLQTPFECDSNEWTIDPMSKLNKAVLLLCANNCIDRGIGKTLTVQVLFTIIMKDNVEKHISKVHLKSNRIGSCDATYEDMSFNTEDREKYENARIDISPAYPFGNWIDDKSITPLSGVTKSVYGTHKIPCRIYTAVKLALQSIGIECEHNQIVSTQPNGYTMCNIAAMFNSHFNLTESDRFAIIQCFKFHEDMNRIARGPVSSNRCDQRSYVLLFRLYDIYLYANHRDLFEQAKRFCEANETTDDDPLRNIVCKYCNQSDNPCKWSNCFHPKCSTAYHIDYCYPLSRHDTGLVINTNWFCHQQCFDECEKLHKIMMTWMSKKKMW